MIIISPFPSQIPTDSLIIKGKYETLTIAIIGVLARPKSPVSDRWIDWIDRQWHI